MNKKKIYPNTIYTLLKIKDQVQPNRIMILALATVLTWINQYKTKVNRKH